MSSQGLSDRARFEAFSRRWRDVVLQEAEKWCLDNQVRDLLTDAVLAEFRQRYADRNPPGNLDYYLRAQVCIVFSHTGQNTRKLQRYIDEHSLPEEPAEQPFVPREAPAPRSPAPEAPVYTATAEAAPAPAEAPTAPVPPKAPEAPVFTASAPAAPAAPPEEPKRPSLEELAAKPMKPDTFLDPERTTLWTPEGETPSHVVQEIELPDEEEEERSVIISFINTLLFVVTVGAFGFCVYETGFFQYLFQ